MNKDQLEALFQEAVDLMYEQFFACMQSVLTSHNIDMSAEAFIDLYDREVGLDSDMQ
jgi:hypothetical protein